MSTPAILKPIPYIPDEAWAGPPFLPGVARTVGNNASATAEAPTLQKINLGSGAPPELPVPSQPNVVKAPNALEQNITNDAQQLQKVRWNQANPWGTANNHPGTMGKIAHVLSVAGNIAGNIVAPGVMANVPGSQLNMQEKEGGLAHRLNSEEQEESGNQERDALTQKTQQETADLPQEETDKHDQSSALTDEAHARAQTLQEPSLATAYAHAVQQALKNGTDPAQDPVVQHLSDAIVALQPGQNKAPVLKESQPILGPDGKPHVYELDEQGNKVRDEGVHYERPMSVNIGLPQQRFDQEQRQNALKLYQPALDSAERFNVMSQSYEKAVKDHDQQAMLNLLANHLGMTMGLQKGARITRDLYQEAAQSTPWLQKVGAKFDKDGYLSGVTLNPQQMRQMVDLGRSRYVEDLGKAKNEAGYVGVQDDGPTRTPNPSTINYYIGLAGGDPAKAKQLAKQDGWSIP